MCSTSNRGRPRRRWTKSRIKFWPATSSAQAGPWFPTRPATLRGWPARASPPRRLAIRSWTSWTTASIRAMPTTCCTPTFTNWAYSPTLIGSPTLATARRTRPAMLSAGMAISIAASSALTTIWRASLTWTPTAIALAWVCRRTVVSRAPRSLPTTADMTFPTAAARMQAWWPRATTRAPISLPTVGDRMRAARMTAPRKLMTN